MNEVIVILRGPKQIFRDWLMRYGSGLRFPKLLGLAGLIFLADLFLPDVIPFVDEILFGLITLLLASLRKSRSSERDGSEPTVERGKERT
jgi:hypothetical protein